MIKESLIINEDNQYYGTDGGNNTTDKLFILSVTEVMNTKYGFDSNNSSIDINRRCAPTDYAVAQGTTQYTGPDEIYNTSDNVKACVWWVRSPGLNSSSATIVSYDGSVIDEGAYVYTLSYAVRPALYIKLNT